MKNVLKLDRRFTALLLTLVAIVAIKISIDFLPTPTGKPATGEPASGEPQKGGTADVLTEEQKLARARALKEVDLRFKQAVTMLHAKRYDHAVTALQSVLKIAPEMPEAYVNLGFAMIGLEKYEIARNSFIKAIDLKSGQNNAYYGLAVAEEKLNNLFSAIAAMESYLHIEKEDTEHKRKAASAIWEWREALKKQKSAQNEKQNSE